MQSPSTDDYPFYSFQGVYYFVTDDGRSYSVSFEDQPFFSEDEYVYARHTYEVFLRLEKSPPSYNTDPKVGATVTAIIQDFVNKDPLRIIFFTCDTSDGRQFVRFRKFSLWFSEYQNGKYGRYDERIFSPITGKEFLIMMLIRTDNPNRANVIASYFELTAQLRARK